MTALDWIATLTGLLIAAMFLILTVGALLTLIEVKDWWTVRRAHRQSMCACGLFILPPGGVDTFPLGDTLHSRHRCFPIEETVS